MQPTLWTAILSRRNQIQYDDLSIDSATLPNGATNTAYPSTTLTVTGGSGSVTWTVTSGALPTGLSINSSTGEISGTPTATHSGNIEFTATDATAGDSDSITLALTVVEPVLYMPTDQLNNVLALCNIAGAEWTDSVGGTQATAGQDIAYLEDLSGYDDDSYMAASIRPQWQSDHWAIAVGSGDAINISQIADLINNRQEFEIYIASNPTWTTSNQLILEFAGNGITVRLRRTAANQYYWYVDNDEATANQQFGGTTFNGFQVNRITGTSTQLIASVDGTEQVVCDYTTGDYDFTGAYVHGSVTSETYGIFVFTGNHNSAQAAAMLTWCQNRYNTAPSFTALGFAASVTGGQGGTTYTVTTLSDTLPNGVSGEFRYAVTQTGARIVEFDSSLYGWIELKKKIEITNDDITIDGSTAGGKGVGITFSDSADYTVCTGGILVLNADNIIVKYLRIYPGNAMLTTADLDLSQSVEANVPFYQNNGLDIFGTNILVHHCQIGAASDGLVDVWGADTVTFQNNVFHIAQNQSTHPDVYTWNGSVWVKSANHGFMSLIGNDSDNISYINNVIMDTGGRLPDLLDYLATGSFEWLGNATYNQINSTFKCYPDQGALDVNICGNWTSQIGPDTSVATNTFPAYIAWMNNSNPTFYAANNYSQYLYPNPSTIAYGEDRINNTGGATDNGSEITLSTDTTIFPLLDTTAKLMAMANECGVNFNGSDALRTEALTELENAANESPSGTSRLVDDFVLTDLPSLA